MTTDDIAALEKAGFVQKETAPGRPYWSKTVRNLGDVEVCFEPRVFGGFDLGVYAGPGPELVLEQKLIVPAVEVRS